MIDTSMLPQPGELIVLPDGDTLPVAWCSGWTWPLDEPAPTRLYAQPLDRKGKPIKVELCVIPAVDAAGTRFWLAERRTP